MSSATLSKDTERVKSLVETNDSRSDCEVSTTETSKENSDIVLLPVKSSPSHDNTKLESKLTENKMSSESPNRNPLVESASILSNNESNRTSNNGIENKTVKSTTNAQNEANNNNSNPKLRARAAKKSASPTPMSEMSACGWCSDSKPTSSFHYNMHTLSGDDLRFCSEMCIAEFRKAVKKGGCKQCGNVVTTGTAPNKEYCSLHCMNKATPKNGIVKPWHGQI